jgi:hypothetical protein
MELDTVDTIENNKSIVIDIDTNNNIDYNNLYTNVYINDYTNVYNDADTYEIDEIDTINSITQTFLELLEDKNNLYKYRSHYENYIKNNHDTVEEILLQYLRFIKYEHGACRTHNENEGKFEVIITKKSLPILRKLMQAKINEYNRLLDIEQHIVYEKKLGDFDVDLTINFDEMRDSTAATLIQCSQNLRNLYSLKNINYVFKNKDRVAKLIHYFECLSYYS